MFQSNLVPILHALITFCFLSLLQIFDNKQFKETLKEELLFMTNFDWFHLTFKSTVDKFVPVRKKKVRCNDKPFLTKSLRKTIMIRSTLKNKYKKDRRSKNMCVYEH